MTSTVSFYIYRRKAKTQNTSSNLTQPRAFDGAKNHKRQRRKRKSVIAKREKSQKSSYRLG